MDGNSVCMDLRAWWHRYFPTYISGLVFKQVSEAFQVFLERSKNQAHLNLLHHYYHKRHPLETQWFSLDILSCSYYSYPLTLHLTTHTYTLMNETAGLKVLSSF